LFEVLIAAVVLTIGLLGLSGLLDTSVKATASTRAREGATNLAREILEDARTIPFAQISGPTEPITRDLQEMKGLENATPGSTWTILRRESGTQKPITYTVAVEECSIDDPKDGLAKEHDSTFCAGQKNFEGKPGETEDQTPIDFKRVTVNVTWSAQGRPSECTTTRACVHEVAMLSSAGEAVGLSASELKLVPPPAPAEGTSVSAPLITEAAKELAFSVNAPKGSTAVRWSLEGVPQSPAPELKEGTTWIFKWKIEGLSDGTYQVSAQAITTTGVLGPPVSIPVTLVRGAPGPPKARYWGFNEVYVAGVKKKVAELQWEANSERNVIGYRVYRPGSSLACPESVGTLSAALTCVDFGSPNEEATYSLAALYRNAKGEVAEGAKREVKLAWPGPTAPNPPTELKAKKEPDGSVTLTWKAPKEGTSVAFYRIYRGSTNYTSRYDTASAVENPSYNDSNATTTHEYWVTAVDSSMRESTPVGPVTG
jgi:hypothetical protein